MKNRHFSHGLRPQGPPPGLEDAFEESPRGLHRARLGRLAGSGGSGVVAAAVQGRRAEAAQSAEEETFQGALLGGSRAMVGMQK